MKKSDTYYQRSGIRDYCLVLLHVRHILAFDETFFINSKFKKKFDNFLPEKGHQQPHQTTQENQQTAVLKQREVICQIVVLKV